MESDHFSLPAIAARYEATSGACSWTVRGVFDDEDEAVSRANETFFGLGAGLMPHAYEEGAIQVAGLLSEGGYKFGKYHDVRMYEHRLGNQGN